MSGGRTVAPSKVQIGGPADAHGAGEAPCRSVSLLCFAQLLGSSLAGGLSSHGEELSCPPGLHGGSEPGGVHMLVPDCPKQALGPHLFGGGTKGRWVGGVRTARGPAEAPVRPRVPAALGLLHGAGPVRPVTAASHHPVIHATAVTTHLQAPSPGSRDLQAGEGVSPPARRG